MIKQGFPNIQAYCDLIVNNMNLIFKLMCLTFVSHLRILRKKHKIDSFLFIFVILGHLLSIIFIDFFALCLAYQVLLILVYLGGPKVLTQTFRLIVASFKGTVHTTVRQKEA